MTAEEQKAQWKRVKSAIAINIADWQKAGFTPAEITEGILALTGDDGKRLVVVLDPDQEMPDWDTYLDTASLQAVLNYRRRMFDMGWRRIIHRE